MDGAAALVNFSEMTRDIKVSAHPNFLVEDSDPLQNVFTFSYTITIENCGMEIAQLLKRHWFITSGGEPYSEVEGEGVIGEQPILRPGEKFEYTSWSIIKDPIGTMCGTYLFKATTGEIFDVVIPTFSLVNESCIH